MLIFSADLIMSVSVINNFFRRGDIDVLCMKNLLGEESRRGKAEGKTGRKE